MPRKADLKLKSYNIIAEAVENGIIGGINKYEKYHDDPITHRDSLEKLIDDYVMNALCEVIDFGE